MDAAPLENLSHPNQIPVVDSYGNLRTIDASEAQSAIETGGFKIASPEEIESATSHAKYGEGFANELKAAAAGVARAGTFGLSDAVLAGTGLVKPETLRGLEHENPVASIGGEIGGIAGSLMFPPLLGAKLLTPVAAVSKLGTSVTGASRPVIEKLVSGLASQEARPLAHKVLSEAGSFAMGSAVEGAIYGAGRSVSEAAMGDPSLNAEKILSNIGYTAALAGGLGGIFGGTAGLVKGIGQKAREAVHGEALEGYPTLSKAADFEGASQQTKDGLLSGLTKLKPDADAIIEAANTIDAPVMEGQLSSSAQVQRYDSLLTKSPTFIGARRKALYDFGYNKASEAAQKAMASDSDLSLAQVGESLQNSISEKIKTRYEPVQELYEEIRESYGAIPISEKSVKTIANNIRKLPEADFPEGKALTNKLAETFEGLKNVDQVKRFKTYVYDSLPPMADKFQKRITHQVAEKLQNFEESMILNFAMSQMKTPKAKARIMDLLSKRREADNAYKLLMEHAQEIKDLFGRRKVQGPQDFINFISDELTPERFATKLFDKKNSNFLQFFSKNYPNETHLLIQYEKAKILKEASNFKNGFNPTSLFKKLDSLPKEMRDLILSDQEKKMLNASRKYLSSFPPDINPSGTSMGMSYQDLLSFKGAWRHVNDFVLSKGMKFLTGDFSDLQKGYQPTGPLTYLEGKAKAVTNKVISGAKSVFDFTTMNAETSSAFIAEKVMSTDEYDKLVKHSKELMNNPAKFSDVLEKATESLHSVAPDITANIQQSMIKAVQVLSNALKDFDKPNPLSPKLPPSKSDRDKISRYLDIIDNPTSVFAQIKDASITPETMETLAAVYPKLLAEMKTEVLTQLTDYLAKNHEDIEIPYRTKMALSLFLGQDLDESLNSDSIQRLQQAISMDGHEQAMNQMEGQARVSRSGMGKITQAKRTLTNTQSIAQKNS